MLRVSYFNYRKFIDAVLERCGNVVKRKDEEYGGSWKKRGGRSAWFMLARKWDRLEEQVSKSDDDIFLAASNDHRDEGILDDVRDLMGYLVLVESEIMAQRDLTKSDNINTPKFVGVLIPPQEYVCPFANIGETKCERAKCSHCNGERG